MGISCHCCLLKVKDNIGTHFYKCYTLLVHCKHIEPKESLTCMATKSLVAAIFGVTGLVGRELAKKLLSTRKWKVYGIARRSNYCSSLRQEMSRHFVTMENDPNYHFISCDLLNPRETQEKLSRIEDVTHVFWVTWVSHFPLDTPECSENNKAMMSNALNAILPNASELKHVSLQTGTKHYVSLGVASLNKETTFFDECSPRVDEKHNFYYALEDLLHERLRDKEVGWSIHRPGLITGCSTRTAYNFMGSLCVYGTICKYLNLPFVFGGTKQRWEEMSVDASDARLVADQHIWAATTIESDAKGEAFNAVNGESYTWKEIWMAIGEKLGTVVCEEKMFDEGFVYSMAMADKEGVWRDIVEKEGLVETKMEDLANWGFMDILFRCPVKMLATRNKADRMGFKTKYHALESILYWIDVMRAESYIP